MSSVHTSDLSDSESSDSGLLQCVMPCLRRAAPGNCGDMGWHQRPISDPKIEPFISSVGPTTPLSLDAEPVQYFCQLFPPDFLTSMAVETDSYALEKKRDKFSPSWC